ncbi:PepSY-associated TM helix domain-containing protein [Nostoc sp.]|uniref:PepSY-associated TM helix domain-containing protein n=1 Tax=Nostoc sp. TaxID=1180 RepID=UPI002FF8175F
MDSPLQFKELFLGSFEVDRNKGDRQWETSWIGRVYELHYKLLAGDTGLPIVGIVALLTLILRLTGIVLWPGWRKLVIGT